MAWCDEKISKFGDDASKKLEEPANCASVKESPAKPVLSDKIQSEQTPSEQGDNQPTSQLMPTPKIKVSRFRA